ncbi:SRPBCC domain-containing protein [Olivibacter sp. SDN3]|uniref:SRPBCC domain-containing protein n=1 Tax=Olivibacter sp. SDN3 TaxID=2764720 RepID=UPI0016515BF2|nr:SRPBCC domain-containing protein [Olivibacter sp. SDN3]QNL47828.1 SRPBCC domain-containing protein [Olivibacter sp. SDN3]
MKTREKSIGLTKDVGWQFGLRKTFSYSQEYLWDFMFSDKGLEIWLGKLNERLEIKKTYKTKEGIEGLVRVFTPYSHIRMNWKKKSWDNMSTVQVRVTGNQKKATISFHQEKLLDDTQREEMKIYWNEKMKEIEKRLAIEN